MKTGATFRRFRQWPLLLALVAFTICLSFAVHSSLSRTDGHFIYALDDAYIHMAMAKNLARHGVWGCTPFHFSASSSSLLWTLGLGIVYFLFGVNEIAPLVLNVLLAVLTLLVSDHYLEKFKAPPVLRAAALLAMVVAFPLPGMVLLGMEHILHLLLTIWFACAAVEALMDAGSAAAARRQTLWLCIAAALLASSRYEGFFLVGLACLGLLARRHWLRAILVGSAAFAPTFVFGVYSLAQGAFFFPNSLMVQAGDDKLSLLSVIFKLPGRKDLLVLGRNRELLALLLLGLLAAGVLWARKRSFWSRGVWLPLLLSLMILLHIHYAFSPMFWVYRYAAYLVEFAVFAAAAVMADWLESGPVETKWRSRGRGMLLVAGIAALTCGITDVRNGIHPAKEIRKTTQTYFEHYAAAKFLARHYPAATVAINDLGAVTFFTEARILDIFGLGDIEPLRIKRKSGGYTKADVLSWTARYRPEIGIFQLAWAWVQPRIPDEWIKTAELAMPRSSKSGFIRIGFYAMDARSARRLARHVKSYYGPKRSRFGYRLTVFPTGS